MRQYSIGGYVNFNPRSPRGERPVTSRWSSQTQRFQSTLPSRGATYRPIKTPEHWYISIHAPLAGSDFHAALPRGRAENFNPRSPRGERRLFRHVENVHGAFQSTLPSRGATKHKRRKRCNARHFNPRSPRGERQLRKSAADLEVVFQSTLPSRGATLTLADYITLDCISIHAPLAGSDSCPVAFSKRSMYFNPRSPRGERQQKCTIFLISFMHSFLFSVSAPFSLPICLSLLSFYLFLLFR